MNELLNPDNSLHQLFYSFGCNLDYVPQTWKEAFVLGLQFVAVCAFFWFLLRFMFKLLCSGLRGGL